MTPTLKAMDDDDDVHDDVDDDDDDDDDDEDELLQDFDADRSWKADSSP